MSRRKEEPNERKDSGRDISEVLEKLISERLGAIKDTALLGGRIFRRPESSRDEASYLETHILQSLKAKIIVDRTDFQVGEDFRLGIQLENIGKTPVSIAKIDGLIPPDSELCRIPGSYNLIGTFLDSHGRTLSPGASENIEVVIRPTHKGTFLIAPRVVYANSVGLQMSVNAEPITILVSETILPNRIRTGFQDLDNLLFGGIPRNTAVILTSISCDERDLLVKRFLEAGAKEGNTTFCVIVDPEDVRSLAEEFKDSFHVLACTTSLDQDFEKFPNITKAAGIENLTEVNIALETMLNDLGKAREEEGRACLEILSDILLEHGAVQTRKWLSRLIPNLRSRGFTTLAVVNPHMHTSEQVHAILDLFDGEISIYEKDNDDFAKYLRIKKMHRQTYLENELPLRKSRLMTTPLTLSCCRRAFNI